MKYQTIWVSHFCGEKHNKSMFCMDSAVILVCPRQNRLSRYLGIWELIVRLGISPVGSIGFAGKTKNILSHLSGLFIALIAAEYVKDDKEKVFDSKTNLLLHIATLKWRQTEKWCDFVSFLSGYVGKPLAQLQLDKSESSNCYRVYIHGGKEQWNHVKRLQQQCCLQCWKHNEYRSKRWVHEKAECALTGRPSQRHRMECHGSESGTKPLSAKGGISRFPRIWWNHQYWHLESGARFFVCTLPSDV